MKLLRSLRLVSFCLMGIGIMLLYERKWGNHELSPLFEAAPTSRLTNGDLPVLWSVPAISAIDQYGRHVTEADLRGHVCIVNFIFTRCTTACPLMTAKMVLLQKTVPHPNARFVSFSVDPTHDTPETLKQYAALWKGDESRWLLLSTDRKTLYRTAAGMKVAVLPTDDQDDGILHSNLFFLVDQQSRIRGVYSSREDNAMKQLALDAETLLGGGSYVSLDKSVTDEPPAQAGERLFNSFGCAACHSQSNIAPSLVGLFGGSVSLNDGGKATVDDAYVREAILDPDVRIVAGYLQLMPSYREYLSDQQVDSLIAYLRSLRGGPTDERTNIRVAVSPQARPPTAIDPVCGMEVRVGDDMPHVEHQGNTYHFCSDHCREMFTRNPNKYASQHNPS